MKRIKFFSKLFLLLVISLYWATLAMADVPYTFENGQVADADQINANFSDLDNRIDSVSSVPSVVRNQK